MINYALRKARQSKLFFICFVCSMESTERDSMLDRGRSTDNGNGSGGGLKDRWNYVKMASLYAGVASLFPWNMLITVSGKKPLKTT